jgi:hypothetical protein
LCFSFINLGRRELREREKKKKKKERKKKTKAMDWLGLSDLASSYSKPANRQASWRQLPDSTLGCYAL